MSELLQVVDAIGATGPFVALFAILLLIRVGLGLTELGHALLALRRDWDDYRANRPRDRRPSLDSRSYVK